MPKIFATVRVKSRILSRVIYSASQQGGGVALQNGSGTTFNVDKIDLGGVQNANATIRKDNQRTFQILPPSVGGDGEHQQFILSNAELFMQYFKSGEINVTLGMEKTGLGVLNVGGMYLIAQDGTASNVAGISILKDGTIAVGDNLGADRFTKMYYRHDNHAKWAALSQALQNRILPDIEWVLINKQGQDVTFSETINYDAEYIMNTPVTQAGVYNFVKGSAPASGNGRLFGVVYLITSNGNVWNFTSDFKNFSGDLALVAGAVTPINGTSYRLVCMWNGTAFEVAINAITINAGDITAPAFITASFEVGNIADNIVVLPLDEALDPTSVPAVGDFAILVDASPNVVTNVDISTVATQARLTLTTAVTSGQTVTAAYTKGSNPLRDVALNETPSLTATAVTNNVSGSIILFEDDFAGTTIDTGKWTAAGSVDIGITQNDEILFTDLTTNASAATASLSTDTNFNRDTTGVTTVIRFDIDDSGVTVPANYRSFDFLEDANEIIRFEREGIAPNTDAVFRIKEAGSWTTNTSTGVEMSGSWKILITGGTASIYKWGGANWGSALVSGSYTDMTGALIMQRLLTSTTGDVVTFDNVYVTDTDFATLIPT